MILEEEKSFVLCCSSINTSDSWAIIVFQFPYIFNRTVDILNDK